ncbi:hypothetical protein [uncultured Stenotrophomonas sp.]|uniref:hypothetical protein n=1 Tax=uncultured Stenotrophomonas sp. TaxID=165438 RepID=UPI0028D3A8C5|nr:hypothetical protein [uncultured Stenotrophomonas sp.]
MAIEFCPLADDIGNLADWSAVVVGSLAAIATTFVAVLAYKTSSRATAIAGEAKTIAEQQRGDLLAQKDGTARILGSLLQMEVGLLPAKLAQLFSDYDGALAVFLSETPGSGDTLETVIRDLHGDYLPAAEGVLDQLHTLPDQLGALVATVIGMSRDIADTGKRVNDRFKRIGDWDGGIVTGYRGDKEDLRNLREQLRSMLVISIKLAEAFNQFTKTDSLSYENERAVAGLS